MRPKFVFALLIISGSILGAVLFLKQHLGSTASKPASAEPAIAVPVASVNVEASVTQQPVIVPVPPKAVTPEQRQANIDAETDRLQRLSMSDDPASLPPILADLTNTEKEVRDAAINAVREFGSKDAIPALKAAVENTDDTKEKIDLLEAIDFLSLPRIEFGNSANPTPEQIQAEANKHAQRHPQTQDSPTAPNN